MKSEMRPTVVPEDEFNCFVRHLVSLRTLMDDPQQAGPLLVAIAGVPGSGKSTLAAQVVSHLNALTNNPRCAVNVPMDGYHLRRSELALMANSEEAFARRGAEWTFDVAKLCRDLKAIRALRPYTVPVQAVLCPSFDHSAKDPRDADIAVTTEHRIVVMEGNYLSFRGNPEWDEVYNQFHVHCFLLCSIDVSTERLAQRHMKAWNVPHAEAMERASNSDRTNAVLVERTMQNSHFVLKSLDVPGL